MNQLHVALAQLQRFQRPHQHAGCGAGSADEDVFTVAHQGGGLLLSLIHI